ncbi:MAG: ABC transporter substrate-binding protein [candidate division WOR-3 bacterium]
MVLISLLFSILIYDDLGNKLSIRSPPERVVSLSPNLTDFLIYFGLEDKVVGKTYIDKIKGEDVIIPSGFLSREKILKLNPDIVFAGDINSIEDIEWMKKNKINVFYIKTENLIDIINAFIKFGRIFGIEKKAIFKLKGFLDTIYEEKIEFKGNAMVIIDLKGGIWSCGKNTFVNEILEISGFKNFTDFFEGYKIVSKEKIDFEKINYFIISHPDVLNDLKNEDFYKKIKDKIYVMKNYEYFTRPSPFILRAIKELRKIR